MLRLLAILLILLSGSCAISQESSIQLDVNMKDDDNGKKLAGVKVEVYKNGKLFVSKSSSSNGKVPPIDLPVGEGAEYQVYLKKEGYVTKMANIDAHFDYPEDLAPLIPFQFQTSLFKKVDGVDFSFLESSPMIKMSLDDGGYQTYDPSHLEDMKDKITDLRKEMEKKKEEQEEKMKDYQAYVDAGDGAVKKENYTKAIEQYNLALAIKDDADVKVKRDDAQKKFDAENASVEIEKAFSEKMAAAKKAFDANDLNNALSLYKEASAIKTEEKLPKDRIAEIEAKLANSKAQEEAFNGLVTDGDAAVGAKDYDTGISKYEEALKLKDDGPVKKKLDDAIAAKEAAKNAEAAAAELDEKYNKVIAEADKAFGLDDFDDAKSKYTEALSIKAEEQKPKDQIKKIDEILKKKADADAASNKLETDYKNLVSAADLLFKDKDWSAAKIKYEAANKLKKDENHPIDQISLINKALADEEANAEINEKYTSLMTEAKNLFDQKKYKEALSYYEEASSIKTDESAPKEKISEIQTILSDLENAGKINAAYEKLMLEGDKLRINKDYTAAISSFKEALDLKPEDEKAQTKIDEINKIIENEQNAAAKQNEFDQFVKKGTETFNAKDYSAAKLNYQKALEIKDDAEIIEKIKEIDNLIAAASSVAEIQEKYDVKMKEAGDLYSNNDYRGALEKYEEALSIKSNENEPKNKIEELKETIAKQEAGTAANEKFNTLVNKANELYSNKEYTEALVSYKEALLIKSDIDISAKITKINTLMAEQSQDAEKDELYLKQISKADVAFNKKDWEAAICSYKLAQAIKSNEKYPGERISKINANISAETDAKANEDYQKIIDQADQLLKDDNLDDAIASYNRAFEKRPSDSYPNDQIEKINQLKKDRDSAISDKDAIEKEYLALVKKGDEALNTENYQIALSSYKEALLKKSSEPYPKNKIEEINSILSAKNETNQLEQDYNAKIKEADDLLNEKEYAASIKTYRAALSLKDEPYPKTQISKVEELMKQESVDVVEVNYQKILFKAQEKLGDQDYTGAISLYERARKMKPSDPIPQQRIDEINQLLVEEAAKSKKIEEYDRLIKQADADFEGKIWADAKKAYTAALAIMNEQYPKDQLDKIAKSMRSDTNNEMEAQYQKIIKKADEYFNTENWEKAKSLYKRALKLKNYDPYPKDQLAAINEILNPSEMGPEGYTLNNYGDPNRSTNYVDLDALIENSNDQEQFNVSEEILKRRQEAEDKINSSSTEQVDANVTAKNQLNNLENERREIDMDSDSKRVQYEKDVTNIEEALTERDRSWSRINNDDIQHAKQSVTDIEREIAENKKMNDLPREEYLADIERIKIERDVQEKIYKNAHINETYDTRTWVEEFEEDNVLTDPNNDIDRKNAEIYVEDLKTDLNKSNNKNSSSQEDAILKAKEQTEKLIDEVISSNRNADSERIKNLSEVDNLSTELLTTNKGYSSNQYDVTIETKNYTEKLIAEIEYKNIGNDQPRINAEKKVVELEEELNMVEEQNRTAQNNVLFESDKKLDNLEIEMSNNKNDWDKSREDHEKDVETISDKIVETNANRVSKSNDATNKTEDLARKLEKDQNDFRKLTDEKADNAIDLTGKAVDNLIAENNKNLATNNIDVENTADYIDALKSEKRVEKETPTNKLGEDFPEGMTEEIFTFEDDDGLVNSYVVRRIVVKNGHGIVYEKTKKKYGTTTYMKNGNGITETQWQDETEASDLVRN